MTPTATANASFVKQINDIFDALNSRTSQTANKMNSALQLSNPVPLDCLRAALSSIDTWIIKKTDKMAKNVHKRPPCFDGLELTIASTLALFDTLVSEGYLFLLTL